MIKESQIVIKNREELIFLLSEASQIEHMVMCHMFNVQNFQKALNVLIQQPEVDPKRISITDHSEGAITTKSSN